MGENHIDEKNIDDEDFLLGDTVRNIESTWNEQIHQFDLLSDEEVLKYGKCLKLANDLFIVNQKKRIDLGMVLSNLTNSNAEKILSDLLDMYSEIQEHSLSKEEKILLQYQKKYKELGRILNDEELKKMGIIKKKDIDEDVLVNQVSTFISYNIAKYKMIHANFGLISSKASKYGEIFRMDKMDLIQEGNIGLINAVDHYDVDKGFKFSTYAIPYIVGSILKYASSNYSLVKTGAHYREQYRDFQKKYKELVESTGRTYSALEVSKLFNMNYEDVLDFMLYDPNPTYLDQKIGDDEDTTIQDLIPAGEIDFDKTIFLEELREVFGHYIHKLPPNVSQVIRLLYGINDENRSYSEKEVADKLGISSGAVLVRHKKGLALIRALVQRNGKKDHLQHFK